MSKKRQERKQRQREKAVETETKEATPPLEPSKDLKEANERLRDHSRVVNMKDAASRVKKAIPAGGVKSHAGARPPWAANNPKLPPANSLPGLPRVRSLPKPKPLVECECGCGGKTKSRFVPGHDSYLRALVMRVERDVMSLEEVESMVGKGQRVAVERIIAEKKKAARAEKKKGGGGGGSGKEPMTAAALPVEGTDDTEEDGDGAVH